MHVFPQLRKVEGQYQKELVVVGVHSAKFTSERETPNLHRAVLRHRIQHPVVNDRDFTIWRQYAVRAWPTLMFIDPTGKVVGKHEGEISHQGMDRLLAEMIREYEQAGTLDRRPLPFQASRTSDSSSSLSFPAKLIADAVSGRLFISDTNHNRIVIVSLAGEVKQVIGSGEAGLKDGDLGSAQFSQPHGLALQGDILYVADTENHALRKVDLASGKVGTIAGTGEQGRMVLAGKAARVSLNSPWDVLYLEGALYIAMAGLHQLWAMDLSTQEVYPFAGSGHEGLADGPRLEAWLAQPSGLAANEQRLYFADSETSAIRSVTLDSNGEVETIVGIDLFDFGDRDGSASVVRLQHPLGVAYHDGALYVADTYNSKVKQVFPKTRGATTLLGTGQPGHRDGEGKEAQFHEPGGLCVARGKLYVADTNNHAIRIADLSTRRVETLKLSGL